jgi:glutathione synthase/RimK-type ligase-like ATP-grasp enzyme
MKILVISSKKSWADKRLAQEAIKAKIALKFVTADKITEISPGDFDVLYIRNPYINVGPKYLPQVVKLAKTFKKAGKKVVDANIANGKLAQGKWVDYQRLKKAGLPIPKTDLRFKIEDVRYPVVAKWIYGMKGKNVFLVNNKSQLKKILPLHSNKEWLAQEFIKADYEYKIIAVGHKVLPVILRFKIQDSGFRVDFEKYTVIPSASEESLKKSKKGILHSSDALRVQDDAMERLVAIAEKAAKALGRELAKVDILESKGKFYILEVNRFPGLEWYEKLTKTNSTKAFLDYLSRTNSLG